MRRHDAWRAVAGLMTAGLLACAAGPHGSEAGHAPSAKAAASDANKAFDDLRDLLGAIHDPGDPLDALTPPMREAGRQHIAKLSPTDLRELLRPDGDTARAHPILHMLAGGHDLDAVARTRYGAEADLVALWRAAGNQDLKQLAPIAHDVGRRAAARWLVSTAARLKSIHDIDIGVCGEIELVSTSVGLMSIGRGAVELAAALEPSAERWLKVSNAASMALDVKRAKEALELARRSPWNKPVPMPVADAERRLAAAQAALARTDANASAEALLVKARALAGLGRDADVIDLLLPRADRLAQHAGLAVSLADATFVYLADQRCPIGSGTEVAQVCFTSLDAEPTMRKAIDLSREAWATGNGRDTAAAISYIGILHLLPLARSFLVAEREEPKAAAAHVIEQLDGLERALLQAEAVAPELQGLHLYAETMRHFVGRAYADSMWPNPAARADFEARAVAMAKSQGDKRWGQMGVVFAAALLSLDGNGTRPLDALPAEIEPDLRLSRATARLWAAVIEHDAPAIAKAENEMTAVMPSAETDPVARQECMLLLAEVNALSTSDPAAYRALASLADKTTGSAWPAPLRVRAIIDSAGALARAGEADRALALLRDIPAADRAAADHLGNIATAYTLVLQAMAAHGAERKSIIQELDRMHGADGIPTSSLWLDMWLRELTFMSATEGCGPGSACVQKATKERQAAEAGTTSRVGPWLSQLMQHGGLNNGTFSSGLGYSTVNGIFARMDFTFALPAVQFPPR